MLSIRSGLERWSQHTENCKLTREGLQNLEYSCNKDTILEAYDKMIKDHGGNEDICMIRLIVKQNIEALPRTKVSRRHEIVRDEKEKPDADDSVRKTRNEGRIPFVPLAAQGRPVSVVEKKPRPEELDPTVDRSSTIRTKKSACSSVAAAATIAAAITTGIILTNEKDSESSGGCGVSSTAATGGILEAASAQAGGSNSGMQAQVNGPPVVANKKTKQAQKCKPAKVKTIAELLTEVLSSDVATVEGALDVLLEKKLWKSRRKELRDEVLNRGGCMVGIQALRAPLGSRLMKRKACQLLIAISHEREDIKRIILNPDGLVLIVNAMNANIGSVDLQDAACNALHHLVCGNLTRRNCFIPESSLLSLQWQKHMTRTCIFARTYAACWSL
jgi:hypothetical protein